MNCDYTLITNIGTVRRHGDEMRMTCYAILISNVKTGVCKGASIRGFFADPAAPTFDLRLDPEKAWPYKLDLVPLKIDPGWTCFSQYDLTFADGRGFDLWTLNSKQPIDVTEYSGDIFQAWADLLRRWPSIGTVPLCRSSITCRHPWC